VMTSVTIHDEGSRRALLSALMAPGRGRDRRGSHDGAVQLLREINRETEVAA
jgi:hypothetical protein